MVACRQINMNQEDGRSVSKKLAAIKNMTATAVFLCGTARPRKGILANAKDKFSTHQIKEEEPTVNSEEAYREMVIQHDAVLALEIPPTSWTITQLKSFLKSLKTKEETAMPSKKADLFARYLQWCDRLMRMIEEVAQEVVQEVGVMPPFTVTMSDDEDEQHNKNDDCIAAMMLINNPQ